MMGLTPSRGRSIFCLIRLYFSVPDEPNTRTSRNKLKKSVPAYILHENPES
jgi:hypothetical protein